MGAMPGNPVENSSAGTGVMVSTGGGTAVSSGRTSWPRSGNSSNGEMIHAPSFNIAVIRKPRTREVKGESLPVLRINSVLSRENPG